MSTVLSGIQPTGKLHLGNYLGAIKIWLKLQDECENSIFGIADLHSLTKTSLDPDKLRIDTNGLFIDLMACGLSPNKCKIFVQSLIPEHAELAWILGLVTSFGALSRQRQFKSLKNIAESKEGFIPVNLFNYPLLQAADVLIYKANYVPIGEDQTSHLELTRDIARTFNDKFGETFPLPEGKFTKTARIKSLVDPSKKMSKSLGDKHCIYLFEDEKSIRNKIMGAKTDSEIKGQEGPGVQNLFDILYGCGKKNTYSELSQQYDSGKLQYQSLKEEVANAVIELTNTLKKRKQSINIEPEILLGKLREKSEEARYIAQQTLFEVKNKVGIKTISYI